MKKLLLLFYVSAFVLVCGGCQSLDKAEQEKRDQEGTITVEVDETIPGEPIEGLIEVTKYNLEPLPEGPAPNAPYQRSQKLAYERNLRHANFAPFLYDGKFYAYYSIARRVKGPDEDGYYVMEFKNGPKKGEQVKTKDVIIKTRPAYSDELKKGLVVLVNHWDPIKENDENRVDMWRKGVVYNTDELASKGRVMVEFPYDKNDFLSTKEVYKASNLRIIMEPAQKDIRTFLD